MTLRFTVVSAHYSTLLPLFHAYYHSLGKTKLTAVQLGTLMIGFVPVLKETFPPVLLARRQPRHLPHLSGVFAGQLQQEKPASQVFLTSCTRPLRLMFRTRLIPLLTLYNLVVNSYLLILLSTLGTTFETVYDFSPGASGLAYMGMMVGFLASELTLGLFLDTYATRKARRRPEGTAKPEDRLPPVIFGSLLLPASLLLYGWTLEQRTMWLAPVVGSGLVAFTAMYSYIPVQIYVVDVYTLHTASATGAMSIVRSAVAAVVPLGADPLYRRLGYGWGYTLLAGLAVPFIGIGAVLVTKGERIRKLDSPVA